MHRNALLLIGLAAACADGQAAAELAKLEAMAPDPDATRVEVAELTPSTATLTMELPGEVSGSQDAMLAAAQGGLVEDVRVEAGERVAKGDVLVVIDRDIYAAQVAQAEAQRDQAQAELERTEALGDLATGAERSNVETQVRVAEANLRIARAQLNRTTIRAPFAGTVGLLGVEVGEMANPGAPVARLVDLDPVEIDLSVSDRDVVALREGLEATVEINAVAGQRTGTVKRISPVADLSTRSFLVEVSVPNPERDLLPGMIAKVEVEREVASEAIVVPQDWVLTRTAGYGMFVVDDGVAHWRDVTLGDVIRGQIVVTSGVAAGDRVVMVGQHDLVDGDRVLVAREGRCCVDGRPVYGTPTAQAE